MRPARLRRPAITPARSAGRARRLIRVSCVLDPELPRREYPENPFTAIGVIVRYLMGVNPIASSSLIETEPRLPPDVPWTRIDRVPVLGNRTAVHHVGLTETRLVNESGGALRWRAVFPGRHDTVYVDGLGMAATVRPGEHGEPKSFVLIEVGEGAERTVETSPPSPD